MKSQINEGKENTMIIVRERRKREKSAKRNKRERKGTQKKQ
jgi:hypothetical protein